MYAIRSYYDFHDQAVVIAVTRDITEQIESQVRLARADMEWNQAMDQFDDVVYLIDMNRRLIRTNLV